MSPRAAPRQATAERGSSSTTLSDQQPAAGLSSASAMTSLICRRAHKASSSGSALSNARPLIPEVLALLASGRISPRRVQTAVLPFEQAADALEGSGFKPVFVRDPVNA